MTSTIFAAASGAGRAAISVIRLSGPGSGPALAGIGGSLPPPRKAVLRSLRDRRGAPLDRCLVLWMPGPGTYTGEDCAELHLHGGQAVANAVSACLLAMGVRLAEPGEFTRRAFLNGRMDLLEAEAVADLVAAETDSQRLQALRQMEGAQGEVLSGWAARLRRSLAWQEALIDFPEEDLPAEVEAEMLADLGALLADIEMGAEAAQRGERLRSGLVVAVTGPPNVGKSTLVNHLSGRDVAIVSALPGTTRDVLEVRIDIAGVPVTLIDTAGLRDTADPIEAEGVRRARARAASADLVLTLLEAGGLTPEPRAAGELIIQTKIDLAAAPPGAFGISVLTGEGMAAFRARLAEAVTRLAGPAAGAPLNRARHRAALVEAAESLREAMAAGLPELRAEALRLAMRALGRITGAVDVEGILDEVFGAFCIGK